MNSTPLSYELNRLLVNFEDAIKEGRDEDAIALIKSGDRPNIEALLTEQYGSLIHAAASLSNAGVLSFAISEGCDIEARNPEGFTPFHLAAQIGATACLQCLKDAGANCFATFDDDGTDGDILQLAMPPDGDPNTFRWALDAGVISLTDYYEDDMEVEAYVLDAAEPAWIDALRAHKAGLLPGPDKVRSRAKTQRL